MPTIDKCCIVLVLIEVCLGIHNFAVDSISLPRESVPSWCSFYSCAETVYMVNLCEAPVQRGRFAMNEEL